MSAVQQVQRWAWRLYHVDENSKATDIGLLILRVMVAACLFYHHGGEKFWDFHTLASRPNLNPIGIGVVPSVIYAGFSDGVCSLLVLFGLFSRYAAFFILVCLNTVWWLMNNGLKRLFGLPIPPPASAVGPQAAQMAGAPGQMIAQGAQHVGQLATQGAQHVAQAGQQLARVFHSLPNFLNVPMYILGFLVIFIAGPGRYSLDKILEAKMRRKRAVVVASPAD
jgi:putative oxidoreductase